MRIPKKLKCLSLAVAVAVGLMAGQAQATTIFITDAGGANFGSGSVGYGGTGWLAPDPNSSTARADVYIGGDSFTSTNKTYAFSSTGQFNAWCVDIYHWMIDSATYNVHTGSDLAADLAALRPGTPSGTARVTELLNLADEVYSTVTTANTSAAFQLAVWEIAYGTPTGAGRYQINSTDPGFNVDSGTLSSTFGVLANTWLDQLDTSPHTGNYTLTYLNDGTAENTQDVVVFSRAVPEPGSIALIFLGLAGLGFARRQKA